MPSPESAPRPAAETGVETAAEVSRETLERRGEKAIEAKARAEMEAGEREKLERIARLNAELEQIDGRLAEINARLEELGPGPASTNPEAGEGEDDGTTEGREGGTAVVPPVVPGGETGGSTGTGTETGTGEGTDTGESDPDPEEVKKTIEKAKKKSGFKKFMMGATAVVIAALIAVGGYLGFNKAKNENVPELPQSDIVEILEDQEKIGIYDGYGEKGMWLSEGKSGPYNFANASEVAEVCNNDECDMIKYTAENQVESYADYLANLPEELQPEGFKGLSIIETEKKLESLTDAEYEDLQEYFNNTIDNAFTRRVVLNGSYDNAYMRKVNPDGEAVHDNMEVVHCVTNENNLEVTQFYWLDAEGNEIGNMTVKMTPVYNNDGEIIGFKGCEQVVNEKGKPIYSGLPEVEIPEEAPAPVYTPEEVPEDDSDDEKPPVIVEVPEEKPEDNKPEDKPGPTYRPSGGGPTYTPPAEAPSYEKDAENMERIHGEKIPDEIAEDVNSEKVVITPTPSETITTETLTERPAGEDFEGTRPTIVENEAAESAEQIVQESEAEEAPAGATVISEENDYTENRGGANAGNAEERPVVANPEAQAAADRNEIPVSAAPTGGSEVRDILSDLGIN
ncbi:MAG: hypothetical protein Q4B65_01695 [Candidatus Saccharibacteria bacterium]|nr:hypothetical protein [Candidatus Saccharibacteria bacterium]